VNISFDWPVNGSKSCQSEKTKNQF
jgi:hypothetical protein